MVVVIISKHKLLCMIESNMILSRINRIRRRFKTRAARRVLQADGEALVTSIYSAFYEYQIDGCVFYGSLLGVIREGNLLKRDDDVDFAIICRDNSIWKSVEKAMASVGFKKTRYFMFENTITEMTFKKDAFQCDVFGLSPISPSTLRGYLYKRYPDKEYPDPHVLDVVYQDYPLITPFKEARLGNSIVNIPLRSNDILEIAYGPNWRTPDPNWVNGSRYSSINGVGQCFWYDRSGQI